MDILKKIIHEDAIRRSGVKLGLVTTKFPSLAMIEKRLDDMESGTLHDWLMASASCFPIFPMTQIGGDRYIDRKNNDTILDRPVDDPVDHIASPEGLIITEPLS